MNQQQQPSRPVHSVVVPADIYGAVAQYLASRPYAEVHQLMHAFQAGVQPRFVDEVEAEVAAAEGNAAE